MVDRVVVELSLCATAMHARNGVALKLTDWLSVYAAVLSTVIFVWKLLQRRPRFKVIVAHGIEGKNVGACVIVQNRSSHTVHLAGASVLYHEHTASWREWLGYVKQFKRIPKRLGWVYVASPTFNVDRSCPVAIQAFDSHRFIIQESIVEEILGKGIDRRLIVVAQDRLWNKAYSNPFYYDWSKVLNNGA